MSTVFFGGVFLNDFYGETIGGVAETKHLEIGLEFNRKMVAH